MHNRHRKESFGDELLVSIENANVYIPISKSAMYPNISVESVLFTLPLYLKKFSGLQDLLIDYVNEGVAAYSKYNQFKTQITGHHRSSSSFTTMGQMGMSNSADLIGGPHQNILQKGATKMKRMANTVKKNVTLVGSTGAAGNDVKMGDGRKRDVCLTMTVRNCSLQIQFIPDFYVTYKLHDFTASYTMQSIFLLILEHEIELNKPISGGSERLLPTTKLPEVNLLIKVAQQSLNGSRQRTHTRFPSSATLPLISGRTSHAPSVYTSDGGVSVGEDVTAVQLEVDLLKLELTSRQVSMMMDITVGLLE